MSTPADFVPCYSIYRNEVDSRAFAANFSTQAVAVAFAEKNNLRNFVIRRSAWRINREFYRGTIVYTQRFAKDA